MFRYYLEWLGDPFIAPHFTPVADADARYARRWGMGVAIRDLRRRGGPPRRQSRGARRSLARRHDRRAVRDLSLDGQAVAGGVGNPAQKVLGVRATHGDDVHVPIYAIETSLGAGRVLRGAKALARRSHVRKRLALFDRHATYDHVDPLSALPRQNAFLRTVIPFLRRVR